MASTRHPLARKCSANGRKKPRSVTGTVATIKIRGTSCFLQGLLFICEHEDVRLVQLGANDIARGELATEVDMIPDAKFAGSLLELDPMLAVANESEIEVEPAAAALG